jgi:hypothetical protein
MKKYFIIHLLKPLVLRPRGFSYPIVYKFQEFLNRVHGACLKSSNRIPGGFIVTFRPLTKEASFRFVKLSVRAKLNIDRRD